MIDSIALFLGYCSLTLGGFIIFLLMVWAAMELVWKIIRGCKFYMDFVHWYLKPKDKR